VEASVGWAVIEVKLVASNVTVDLMLLQKDLASKIVGWAVIEAWFVAKP